MTKKAKEELHGLEGVVKAKKSSAIIAQSEYNRLYKLAADADAELNVFKTKHGIR
jgi:hypothetical protein